MRKTLGQLLPPGQIRANEGSVLSRLLDGVSVELQRLIESARTIRFENDPSTANAMLPEWQALFNEMDADTASAIKNAVGGQNYDYILRELSRIDSGLTITEHLDSAAICGDEQARCGNVRCGGGSEIELIPDQNRLEIERLAGYFMPAHIPYFLPNISYTFDTARATEFGDINSALEVSYARFNGENTQEPNIQYETSNIEPFFINLGTQRWRQGRRFFVATAYLNGNVLNFAVSGFDPFTSTGDPNNWGYQESLGWHVSNVLGAQRHVLLILDFRSSGWSNDVTIYNAIDRNLTNVIPRSVPTPPPTTESLEFRLSVLNGNTDDGYNFRLTIDSYAFTYDNPGQPVQVYTGSNVILNFYMPASESVRGIAFSSITENFYIAPMNQLGASNNRPSLGDKWYPTSDPSSRFLVRIVFGISERVDSTLVHLGLGSIFTQPTEIPISSGEGDLRRRDYLVV